MNSLQQRHCDLSDQTRRYCHAKSPILHFLVSPLLHLRLPLACCLWLRNTCRILISTSHACIHAPRRIHRVNGHNDPQCPCPIAHDGCQDYTSIAPIDNVPHVLCQPLGVKILAGALDAALSIVGRAGQALEVEVDEELGGREEEVEEERCAGEGAAPEDCAQQPEEEVDGNGEVEGLVQAGDIRGGQGFGCFLGEGSVRVFVDWVVTYLCHGVQVAAKAAIGVEEYMSTRNGAASASWQAQWQAQ